MGCALFPSVAALLVVMPSTAYLLYGTTLLMLIVFAMCGARSIVKNMCAWFLIHTAVAASAMKSSRSFAERCAEKAAKSRASPVMEYSIFVSPVLEYSIYSITGLRIIQHGT